MRLLFSSLLSLLKYAYVLATNERHKTLHAGIQTDTEIITEMLYRTLSE